MFVSDLKATGLPIDAVTQEWWLHRQLESYNLLASPLPVNLVKQALESNLPTRTERFAPRVFEKENSQMWLSFILRADEIVQLRCSPTELKTVALTLVSHKKAPSTLELISSDAFNVTRAELGIFKHWLLIMPGYPVKSPSRSELIELFHTQLELPLECSIINFE